MPLQENGVLTTDAWMSLQWTDTSLRWDPEEYEDVRKITLPSRLLWQPDIVLYNRYGVVYLFCEFDVKIHILSITFKSNQ